MGKWLWHRWEFAKEWYEHAHFLWVLVVFTTPLLTTFGAWLLNYNWLTISLIGLGVIVCLVIVVDRVSAFNHREAERQRQQEAADNSAYDQTIAIECVPSRPPNPVPPSGIIEWLVIHTNEFHDDKSHKAANIGQRIGEPGTVWSWESLGDGYKCTVKNYGPKLVTNFQAFFEVTCWEWLQTEYGYKQGELKNSYQQFFSLPVLKQEALEVFEFYVISSGPLFVQLTIPTEASVQVIGETKRRTVKLVPQTKYTGFYLTPNAWDRYLTPT